MENFNIHNLSWEQKKAKFPPTQYSADYTFRIHRTLIEFLVTFNEFTKMGISNKIY